MNGQPTAQNTRETGADGDLPGLRNWDNEAHVARARRAVERRRRRRSRTGRRRRTRCRSSATPSRARSSCSGSSPPTRPSRCPSCADPRASSGATELFVVVQDLFMTETARSPTSSCPARSGARRPATFTNADRTVHLSERAVEPPGEARPDLEIFLDYARRMDFRDRDGEPLIKWDDPEGAFEAWKACSRGPPVRLHRRSPTRSCAAQRHPVAVHRAAPDGTSGSTPTASSTPTRTSARTTGTTCAPARRLARRSTGRRSPPAARSCKPPTTSRRPRCRATTSRSCSRPGRTSTTSTRARRPAARPSCRRRGARRLGRARARTTRRARGSREGDRVRVESPRGAIEAPARISGIRPGVVFVPFHYGYWDAGRRRTARRERAHDHRLGPGVQAAAVQGRRRRAYRSALADAPRPLPRAAPPRPGASSRRRSARSPPAHADEAGRRAPLRAARRATAMTTRSGSSRSPRATARTRRDEPERPALRALPGPARGGARAAPRPARPLPHGRGVRPRVDARRAGGAGRARRRAARRRLAAARARPRSSSSGCGRRMKQAAPQALVVAR